MYCIFYILFLKLRLWIHISQSQRISECLSCRALDCNHFFESVRVKMWRGRTCASAWSALLQSVCHIQRALESQNIVAGVRFHWSHEERRFQRERFRRAWYILGATARAQRCAQQTERNGGCGFQTKVKYHFLNQRRWTCWCSCRKSPVSDRQFSFTFLFVLKTCYLCCLSHVTLWRLSLFIWFLCVC